MLMYLVIYYFVSAVLKKIDEKKLQQMVEVDLTESIIGSVETTFRKLITDANSMNTLQCSPLTSVNFLVVGEK